MDHLEIVDNLENGALTISCRIVEPTSRWTIPFLVFVVVLFFVLVGPDFPGWLLGLLSGVIALGIWYAQTLPKRYRCALLVDETKLTGTETSVVFKKKYEITRDGVTKIQVYQYRYGPIAFVRGAVAVGICSDWTLDDRKTVAAMIADFWGVPFEPNQADPSVLKIYTPPTL